MAASSYVLSCLVLNGAASRGLGSNGAYAVLETPEHDYWGPGCKSSRVTKRGYAGLAGGEILLDHGNRGERKGRYELGSGLVLFRLVVPLFQSGVVRPY
jgi:hypothetical protein